MEINNEILNRILNELVVIRWILILIGISSIVLACAFFVIAKALIKGVKRNELKDKELAIELLIDSGDNEEAIKEIKEWLKVQPRHAQAHWLLSKAYFADNQFVEAKRNLLLLLEFAPHYEAVITPFLDKIENQIKTHGPKILK